MLRCPEGKPEARQQLHAALVNDDGQMIFSYILRMKRLVNDVILCLHIQFQIRIPIIMKSNPPDAADLALPLLKELLIANNAFNLEVNTATSAECSLLQFILIAESF